MFRLFRILIGPLLVLGFLPANAPAATGQVVIQVENSAGPVVGARVYVYLERNASDTSYTGQLIAQGTTDNTGGFGFNLSTIPAAQQEAALEASQEVTLSVDAVHFTSRIFGNYSTVVGLNETVVKTVTADMSFPASALQAGPSTSTTFSSSCLAASDPDAGGDPYATSAEPDPDWTYSPPLPGPGFNETTGCSADPSGSSSNSLPKRWVNITQHHMGSGFNGRFCYLAGRNTKTQFVIRRSISGAWGSWQVGGYVTEVKARSGEAGSCSPSMADSDGRPGPLHKTRIAQYKLKKYSEEHWLCDPGGGGCMRAGSQRWKPYAWTGALNYLAGTADQPTRDPNKSVRYPSGDDFWKTSKKNTLFGAGLLFMGFELNSQSGYSSITKLWWYSRPRCQFNWLAGKHDYPAPTTGAIFSYSSTCS